MLRVIAATGSNATRDEAPRFRHLAYQKPRFERYKLSQVLTSYDAKWQTLQRQSATYIFPPTECTFDLDIVMTFGCHDKMWNKTELTSGPLPLWWQIADRLRRAIEHGEFKTGDSLPSEAQLNEAFGVSRTTARAALDRLEQEGLIFRKAGKGSVVLDPKVEQPLSRLSSFADDMRQRGLSASYVTYSVAIDGAPPEVAAAFSVSQGTPCPHITRLLKADGIAMGMSHSWISPDILGDAPLPAPSDLDRRSLYDWLETALGARIVGGTETIEAAVTDRRLSQQLDIPTGSAVLVARRRSHGADLHPIEYAVVSYRADRYRFTVDLVRQ